MSVPDPTMAPEGVGNDTLLALLLDAEDDAAAAGEGLYGSQLRKIESLCRYVDRLHALVRWFDLAYGDNEPVWLFENIYGQPLPANVEMTETYKGVIGTKS